MSPRPFLILLLLLPLLACGDWATPQGTGGGADTPPTAVYPTAAPLPLAFPPPSGEPIPLPPAPPWPIAAPYQAIPLPPDLPPQPSAIPQPAQLQNGANLPPLPEEAWTALASTGEWLLPQPATGLWEPWAWAAEQSLPLYVNDELVLLAVQMANQRAWARAQAEYLPSQLGAVTAAHSRTALAQWEAALTAAEPDPLLVAAAERNMAYFAVAGQLLDPSYPIPPTTADWVASELALTQQGGQFTSPLLGRVVDYTPLAQAPAGAPRAVAWYRQMGLALASDAPWGRLAAQQARLWLDQPSATAVLWGQLALALAYGEGVQGATLPQWEAIAQATAGAPLDVFWLTAAQLPDPTLTLLPLPSSPTAEIFHALTYNRLGVYGGTGPLPPEGAQTAVGGVRLLPAVGDVAAVRGSRTAIAQLEEAGTADFAGWAEQMAGLQARWGGDDPTAVPMTASLGWLVAIQPVLETPAWQVGWLAETADWSPSPPAPAEGGAEWGRSGVVVPPSGALYGRLAAYQRQQLATWQAVGWLSEGNGAELLLVDELLRWLFALSVRQAAGQAFTAEERAWAEAIPARLAYLAGDVALPLRVTLAEDGGMGRTLVAGWGEVRPQVVLVVVEGRPLAAVAIALVE